jgi:hypothetical protein
VHLFAGGRWAARVHNIALFFFSAPFINTAAIWVSSAAAKSLQ